MIQMMNNKENTLSIAFKFIDNHSLSLPKITQTPVNAMFGSVRDGAGQRRSCQRPDQRTPLTGVGAECPQAPVDAMVGDVRNEGVFPEKSQVDCNV